MNYSDTKTKKYHRVELRKDGKDKLFPVHVLIAKCFPDICGEWFEGAEVHHKNHDGFDNRPENLIVVSKDEHKALHHVSELSYKKRSEGQKNTWKKRNHERPELGKRVLQFSKEGEFIAEYPTLAKAGQETNTNVPSLCLCLKGKNKTAGGYIWKYAS